MTEPHQILGRVVRADYITNIDLFYAENLLWSTSANTENGQIATQWGSTTLDEALAASRKATSLHLEERNGNAYLHAVGGHGESVYALFVQGRVNENPWTRKD